MKPPIFARAWSAFFEKVSRHKIRGRKPPIGQVAGNIYMRLVALLGSTFGAPSAPPKKRLVTDCALPGILISIGTAVTNIATYGPHLISGTVVTNISPSADSRLF